MSIRAAITVGLVAAVASCAIPIIGMLPFFRILDAGTTFYVSFLLSAIWLVATVYALAKYRKRGLWSLLGFIPASFWPLFWALISWGCSINRNNCL